MQMTAGGLQMTAGGLQISAGGLRMTSDCLRMTDVCLRIWTIDLRKTPNGLRISADRSNGLIIYSGKSVEDIRSCCFYIRFNAGQTAGNAG
jgi:hypothetical protein